MYKFRSYYDLLRCDVDTVVVLVIIAVNKAFIEVIINYS